MKEKFIKELEKLDQMLEKKNFKNIFFVACGGSMAALAPAQYFIDKEIDLPTYIYNSGEFNTKKPIALDKNSLLIVRSHSGNTPETIEAAKLGKSRGATTIAISMLPDSELCKESDYTISYEWGDDVEAINSDKAAFWRLFFKLAYSISGNEKYLRGYENVENLGKALEINMTNNKEIADNFGRELKRDKIIYTIGSGEYYSIAYAFTGCLLMEMLWINSNPIHAGEYFHGPFEITDFDVPFLLIKGIGATKSLDERAIAFAEKYTDKLYIVDVSKFDLSMFDEDLREYFAVPVTGKVIRMYADGLAEHTGHPLSVRRYMWKMEY